MMEAARLCETSVSTNHTARHTIHRRKPQTVQKLGTAKERANFEARRLGRSRGQGNTSLMQRPLPRGGRHVSRQPARIHNVTD